MLLNLRNSILTEEFDYNYIKHALSMYKNPRVKINDLLKKGKIIRVKKGLYVFGGELARKPYSKETLANLIYGPSYISLEYALSFYGLIPERVETVTSITHKRNKYFNTPVGSFSYKYIHPSIYSCGITIYTIDKHHSILIAEREKALADILYFLDKIKDRQRMGKYLFEDLRMDKNAVKDFRISRVKKLAELYGGNMIIFHKFLGDIK